MLRLVLGFVFGGIDVRVILVHFFGGSTPGLLAGLLGVLGATPREALVTNVGAGPAPRLARLLMQLASLAGPKRRFTPSGLKRPLPRHYARALRAA